MYGANASSRAVSFLPVRLKSFVCCAMTASSSCAVFFVGWPMLCANAAFCCAWISALLGAGAGDGMEKHAARNGRVIESFTPRRATAARSVAQKIGSKAGAHAEQEARRAAV